MITPTATSIVEETFHHLPIKTWNHIFGFLKLPDLGRTAKVCKTFKNIIYDNHFPLYHEIYQKRLLSLNSEELAKYSPRMTIMHVKLEKSRPGTDTPVSHATVSITKLAPQEMIEIVKFPLDNSNKSAALELANHNSLSDEGNSSRTRAVKEESDLENQSDNINENDWRVCCGRHGVQSRCVVAWCSFIITVVFMSIIIWRVIEYKT